MRVYRLEESQGELSTPSVVCLGVFDGVHLGHRKLVNKTLEIAHQDGLLPIVHTYDKLPGAVIAPKRVWIELTPLDEKLRLLEQLGIHHAAVSIFDDRLQHMSGADFFEQVLLGKLKARHLVAGFNHVFGFHGDTNIDRLQEMCDAANVGLSVISPVETAKGNLVSSSAIRAALLLEDEALATEMLGRDIDDAMRTRIAPYMSPVPKSHTTEV